MRQVSDAVATLARLLLCAVNRSKFKFCENHSREGSTLFCLCLTIINRKERWFSNVRLLPFGRDDHLSPLNRDSRHWTTYQQNEIRCININLLIFSEPSKCPSKLLNHFKDVLLLLHYPSLLYMKMLTYF